MNFYCDPANALGHGMKNVMSRHDMDSIRLWCNFYRNTEITIIKAISYISNLLNVYFYTFRVLKESVSGSYRHASLDKFFVPQTIVGLI